MQNTFTSGKTFYFSNRLLRTKYFNVVESCVYHNSPRIIPRHGNASYSFENIHRHGIYPQYNVRFKSKKKLPNSSNVSMQAYSFVLIDNQHHICFAAYSEEEISCSKEEKSYLAIVNIDYMHIRFKCLLFYYFSRKTDQLMKKKTRERER